MTGKEKCEFLHGIRKNIAELNDLEYTPTPCNHEVCLSGTCELCDHEAGVLLRQLKKREAAGMPIRIDTESIMLLETMAVTPTEEDDDEQILMGLPCPPLDGDIIPETDL